MSGERVEDQQVRRAQERVGAVLKGKWTIDRLIGVGGMAVVYAATHRNKKRVAIKMLHPELSIDSDIRARFLREGYVANSVEHPGALRVDDDDVADDGAAFLVMELLEGESVEARRDRKGGKLPLSEVVSIADQLLDVLAAAHEKGVVHRDLKPENLFLNRDGILKVLDFGIARLREMKETSSATRTGSLLGTPAFMPPEQARGRWDDVDARTDLWAAGAIMFTLLSGRLVHEAETVNEALALAITQHPRPIASVMPEVDSRMATVIDRALAYERSARFQDARSMQTAIRDAFAALNAVPAAAVRQDAPSVPDIRSAPAASALPSAPDKVSGVEAAVAQQIIAPSPHATTSRAVTAASKHVSSQKTAPSKGVLIAAAAVGALLMLVVILMALSGGDSSEAQQAGVELEQQAAAASQAPVASPPMEAKPTAANSAVPKGGGEVLSLDQLPVEEGKRKSTQGAAAAPTRAPVAGQAAPAATQKPQEPKPAARVPDFIKKAVLPPPPTPKATATSSSDPFSRRR